MSWVIWITGLPGSGKSTLSKNLLKTLFNNNVSVQYIELDAIRKILTPEPKYDDSERDFVYRSLVLTGKFLSENGINVVIDAVGHKKIWRDLARNEITNFFEIYLKCPIELCMKRETGRKSSLIKQELYKKAMKRLESGKQFEGIGQVPGIDVKYEEPENPFLIIESNKINPQKAAEMIFEKMKNIK
jgi:adenylylsulfate kinase